MSEKTPHRRPATFKLGDPGVIVMDPDETGRPARGTVHVTPEADPVLLPVPLDAPLLPVRRGFRWGTLFWTAVGGLVLLGSGLGIVNLIEDLFARNQTLGYVALAFAAAAALALAVVIGREAFGLARLATIEKLHQRAAEVLLSDDRAASRAVVNDLLKLAHQNPQLARARAALVSHADDIIDGADMIKLAERELMSPLDEEARRLVSTSAQRVSIVTAVSPRALIDVLFVFVAAMRLIRQLARLYGGRPGTLGMITPAAPRHRTSRHYRRHGGGRQPGATDARPRHRRKTLAAARRRRAQRPAHGAAWVSRHRRHPPAAVHRAAAACARPISPRTCCASATTRREF